MTEDERFEAWLRVPLPPQPPHPRLEVRRAHPSEFEKIYELVDEAFGTSRSRALYDWLYRRNPNGTARCWIVVDKNSGKLAASGADCPWSVAQGGQPRNGYLTADYVVAPGWQGRSMTELRRKVRFSHPWTAQEIQLAWPNVKSVGRARKHGRSESLLGPIPQGQLDLGTGPTRTRAAQAGWWSTFSGRAPEPGVEELRSFDSAFDGPTRRCMAWDGFWLPHDSDFLNWRYLEHPTREYIAFALAASENVAAYAVVNVCRRSARLMEFVAPQQPDHVPRALLLRAAEIAREAGCRRLGFFSGPAWPHWPLFRSAGFTQESGEMYFLADGPQRPQVRCLENWRFVPGDHDDR